VSVRALLRASPGAWVLAIAFPIVMVHIDFQPGLTVTAGSTHAHIVLSDLAVFAVVLAGFASLVRDGAGRLRYGIPAWIAIGLFMLLVVAACFYPSSSSYPTHDHLVTAAKYVEYALLAPAAALIVRRREDLALLLAVVVATSVAASTLAVVQFFGWRIVRGWPAGYRQPSFLGHHDFASLSGLALAIALVSIALPRWDLVGRRLAIAAGVAGAVGLFLSGSLAGAIGLFAGAAVCAVVARSSWRRAGAILGIALVVCGGVVIFRGNDVKTFLHYAGIGKKQERQPGVETYIQRTLLVYYGYRVWREHPLLGAGWDATEDEYVFGPLLPALHRKFPGSPDLAFPAPGHPYGVQNGYVQALSDLGIVGLALLLGALFTPLVLAAQRFLRAPPSEPALLAAMWMLVTMGVLSAIGLVAGVPMDAMLWIAAGLCAAPWAAGALRERREP
jgi:O-antigen ligase/polysaccharide polymerase Wzy-like membrane protein